MEGGRGSSFSSRFFAVLAAQAVSIPGGVTVGSTTGLRSLLSFFCACWRRCFFCALAWICDGMGFIMGWAQNGGRGRQFLINFFPHAQFAGDGRGSLPLRTVRCVGTAPPALLPASAVPPGSAVPWGTSNGTWTPQAAVCTSTSTCRPWARVGPWEANDRDTSRQHKQSLTAIDGTLSLLKAAGSHGGLSPEAAQMRSCSCSALSAAASKRPHPPESFSGAQSAAVDVARAASRTPCSAAAAREQSFCSGYLGREVLAAVLRYLG